MHALSHARAVEATHGGTLPAVRAVTDGEPRGLGGGTYDRGVIDLRLVRENPDVVRASQRARGADESLVDALLAADAARREAVGAPTTCAPSRRRPRRRSAARARRSAPPSWSGPRRWPPRSRRPRRPSGPPTRRCARRTWRIPNVVHDGVPPGGEDDAVTLRTVGEVPAYDFPVRDHLEIGELLGAIDMERGAKVSGARFYFLTGPGALLEFALAQLAISRAVAAGLHPGRRPRAGQAGGDGGHRLPRRARRGGLPGRARRPVPGRHLGGRAGRHAHERGARPLRRPAPVRRLVLLLPPRGRLLRQGHPRHHPGALVRQGRDVQLLPARAGRRRAPPAAGLGGGVPAGAGAALPGGRHRRRRPRHQRGPQVRHRGLVPQPGHLPRADQHLGLHHLPGPPAGHPLPRRRRQAADRGDPERHAVRDRPHHRLPARGAPARRRLGARARRRCGRGSAASRSSPPACRWRAVPAPLACGPGACAAGPAGRRAPRPGATTVVDAGRPRPVAAPAGRHRPRRHPARPPPARSARARAPRSRPAGPPASRSSA